MILKKITLIMEDCEEFTFDGGYVGAFSVDKVSKYVGRVLSDFYRSYEKADFIAIEIHRNAGGTDGKLFDRIVRASDIASISFDLVDDSKPDGMTEYHYYMVSWNSEKEHSNIDQKAKVSANGHLYILINKDEDLEDVFPSETVDDVKYDSQFDGEPLLAIRKPDKFRILHLEYHRKNCLIRIGDGKVWIYGLGEEISPKKVASDLLGAMIKLEEEKSAVLKFERQTFEFFNYGDLSDVRLVRSDMVPKGIGSREQNEWISREERFDCEEFILELAAEMKKNIDFWADSAGEESDDKECSAPEEREQLLSQISLLLQKLTE